MPCEIWSQLATDKIKEPKIHENNVREDNKRIPHEYKEGDKVLYQNLIESKYGENPNSGPYTVQ